MEVIEGAHYRIIREGLVTYSQVNASQYVVFVLEKLELTRINDSKDENFHLFIQKITGNMNLKLQVFFRDIGKKVDEEIDISKTVSTMNSIELLLPNKIGNTTFILSLLPPPSLFSLLHPLLSPLFPVPTLLSQLNHIM